MAFFVTIMTKSYCASAPLLFDAIKRASSFLSQRERETLGNPTSIKSIGPSFVTLNSSICWQRFDRFEEADL